MLKYGVQGKVFASEESYHVKSQRTSPTPIKSAIQTEPAADSLERIRSRAYELFEQRGKHEGHEVEDWLQAEAEVNRERTKATAA
jgi:hypothetical protein